jgi:hypothetical protein
MFRLVRRTFLIGLGSLWASAAWAYNIPTLRVILLGKPQGPVGPPSGSTRVDTTLANIRVDTTLANTRVIN